MDSNGHNYYEREAAKLKLMNAAMQLALLQQKISEQTILRHSENEEDTRTVTKTVRSDRNVS